MKTLRTLLNCSLIIALSQTAQADSIVDYVTGDLLQWQTNEIHYQYGEQYQLPYLPGDREEDATIWTLQHASGWKYGDTFFFIDFIDGQETSRDLYTEAYFNFSYEKISGNKIEWGPLDDIGFIAGINYARESEVVKYLPGIRLAWDIPGFAFLNTDITAYIDDSDGVADGGAPSEDDSFMIDINWALPFSIGKHDFSVEGHVEYIDGRDNEFGDEVEWHILGQPQFRYDLGKALFSKAETFFVGVEYQFWVNKLGDDKTNENNVQALAVLRF